MFKEGVGRGVLRTAGCDASHGPMTLTIPKLHTDFDVSTKRVDVPVLDAWDEGFNKYEEPSVTNFAALAWLKRGWVKTVAT